VDTPNPTPEGTAQAPAHEVSAEAIRAQLARVTASEAFANAPVLRRFLQHLVDQALAGKADDLKEYALGTDVFDRGGSFDPRVDTIVRVQARRLRSKLQDYYRTEGGSDALLIELPKGHYVPRFRGAGLAATQESSSAGRRRSKSQWVGLAAGIALGAALTTVLSSLISGRETRDAGAVEVISDPLPPIGEFGRVVVAPFENRSDDPSLDVLGHQAAERVMTALAGVPGLLVTPQRLASSADAGATLVVSGTYLLYGPRLELHGWIQHPANGRLLFGGAPIFGRRDDPEAALQALQQQVAGAVAAHFDDFFGGLTVISTPPTLDAYLAYRAGLEIFESDYTRALNLLYESRAAAPRFLPPLLVIYFAQLNLGQRDAARAILQEMDESARSSGERLLVEFLHAAATGRRTEAVRSLRHLEQLAPDSLVVNHNLVQQFLLTNQPLAAVDAYNSRRMNVRTFRHSIGVYRHNLVIQALHLLGAYERELEQVKLARQHAPATLSFWEAEIRSLAAVNRLSEIGPTIDRSLLIAPMGRTSDTHGDLLEHAALELRVHGHREASMRTADRAVRWYRERRTSNASPQAHHHGLARALYLAGSWVEAHDQYTALALLHPRDPHYKGALARVAARQGDAARAKAIADELESQYEGIQPGIIPYLRASVAAILGDREHAVSLLRDAFTQGMPYGMHIHNDPDFESLAGFAPFIELTRPTG
jgi:hypothetical protein